ncbi:hypothetical protein GCM10011351_14610 [Paraliobacillus quinghaiensis]|uniref:Cytochrome C biogenesis protein transmembrane domain-containing protein n=1 Tax=Paraliobacillus quinghaiensis TaxID=470815 RepID=A0A917WUP1_9BACI|nr:cytochrome c biogenesis protein CcdA [Paraliobacillus quinghaiensis]GGM29585.1 hypothetical protein GCM10011351_14610 [Paraliobacillus quinghaiensis]
MKVSLLKLMTSLFLFFLVFFISFFVDQNIIADNVATTSIILLIAIIFLAGILDGFNPCAFSTLLLWSGFLLHRFGAGIDGELTVEKQRKKILSYAFFYALGIFFIYFLLGVGILELFRLTAIQTRLLLQIAGFIIVVLGVLMIRDVFVIHKKAIIKMPAFLHPIYKKFSEPVSKIGSFLSGIVIGLCSVPCGGAIYMAVLLIIQEKTFTVKYPLLFLYNLGFVLPVFILAFILSNKKLLTSLSRDFILSRGKLKLIIGITTILLGYLSILLS